MTIIDHVRLYAASAKLDSKKFTVFVEGTGDVEYFRIAAQLELAAGGPNLLGDEFAIVAAGEKDKGGVDGLRRQMTTFHALSSTYLKPNGAKEYRLDRKSVVWGKSVSVRVDLGGRRIIKKTINIKIRHTST